MGLTGIVVVYETSVKQPLPRLAKAICILCDVPTNYLVFPRDK